MKELFRRKSQKIKIYYAYERESDPFEKTKEKQMLNPITIRAIIQDLIFSQISWKLPGIKCSKGKDLLIQKKDLNKIKHAEKIEIEGEMYIGYRQNSSLQYRNEGDFVRIYVYN